MKYLVKSYNEFINESKNIQLPSKETFKGSTFKLRVENDDFEKRVYITENDNRGSAVFYWYKDDNKSVYLSSLEVNKNERQGGIGTKLQELRESIAIKLGFKVAYLWVLEDSWMRDWYKRRGYKDLKKHDDKHCYIWMQKNLK